MAKFHSCLQKSEVTSLLQEGDSILRVGEITWEQYRTNMRQELFNHVDVGDYLEIDIQRNGELHLISWGQTTRFHNRDN